MAKKRELVEYGSGEKRYVRRNAEGQFTKDQVSVGRSLSDDIRQHAKKVVKPGFGDQGDQPIRRPRR